MLTFVRCLGVVREQIMKVGRGGLTFLSNNFIQRLTAAWETKLFDQLRTFHFQLTDTVCPKHLHPSQELLITFIMVKQRIAQQNSSYS